MATLYVPENGPAFRAAFFPDGKERHFTDGLCVDQTPAGQGATSVEMAMVFIQFANSVGAGVIGCALYDALRGQAPWVRINGKKIPTAEKDLCDALEEADASPDTTAAKVSQEDKGTADADDKK